MKVIRIRQGWWPIVVLLVCGMFAAAWAQKRIDEREYHLRIDQCFDIINQHCDTFQIHR